MAALSAPVHFGPHRGGLGVWRGRELILVVPIRLLPALILEAATLLRGR
ncbi:hypothetical protein [Rhodovulum sp. ES.010]|nr:hypothetical protein [Rhodovulum sp. ES.010]